MFSICSQLPQMKEIEQLCCCHLTFVAEFWQTHADTCGIVTGRIVKLLRGNWAVKRIGESKCGLGTI
jgi:hypothetical protein